MCAWTREMGVQVERRGYPFNPPGPGTPHGRRSNWSAMPAAIPEPIRELPRINRMVKKTIGKRLLADTGYGGLSVDLVFDDDDVLMTSTRQPCASRPNSSEVVRGLRSVLYALALTRRASGRATPMPRPSLLSRPG